MRARDDAVVDDEECHDADEDKGEDTDVGKDVVVDADDEVGVGETDVEVGVATDVYDGGDDAVNDDDDTDV